MPPANRSKVQQQQQLTMSKRVKQLVNYSDLSAHSKTKVDSQLSTITAPVKSSRSRGGVVLTDEMLLEIKKGLESSVASTLKSKVKRLSGAVKPQVGKLKSPLKRRMSVAKQKKSQSTTEMLPPSALYSNEMTPSNYTGRSVQEKETKKVNVQKASPAALFKTPLSVKKQASEKSADVLFQKPLLGKVNRASSTSSSPQSENWKKKFSPKSLSSSPNHVYFLRSKPESSDRRLTIATFESLPKNVDTVKKVGRPKKVDSIKNGQSIDSTTDELSDDTGVSKKTKAGDKLSRQEEKLDDAEMETVAAREKVRLKRKSDPVHIVPKKRVKAGDLLSTPNVVSSDVDSARRLSVKISRIKSSPGGTVEMSSVESHLLTPTYLTKSTSKSTANARDDSILSSRTHQTPELASSADSTSKKRRSNVRWDMSAANVQLIESIYPYRRETRSATQQSLNASRTLMDQSNDVAHRSILKQGSGDVELFDESMQTAVEPQRQRRLCSHICTCLFLLFLPLAVAVLAVYTLQL